MAEITAYPTAAPKSGDYLLGAQIGEPGDNPANPTKKFTVGSVLTLGSPPLGYTTYTALLNQTGTNAPVPTVIKNDTGYTYTWARTSIGEYTITASGNAFTNNKTIVFMNLGDYSDFPSSWARTSDTVITIRTQTSDDRLVNGSFEIRIYS